MSKQHLVKMLGNNKLVEKIIEYNIHYLDEGYDVTAWHDKFLYLYVDVEHMKYMEEIDTLAEKAGKTLRVCDTDTEEDGYDFENDCYTNPDYYALYYIY